MSSLLGTFKQNNLQTTSKHSVMLHTQPFLLEPVTVMLCCKINNWPTRNNAIRVDRGMASVVVLFYVKHVDSVSNTGCLIYVFGVVEQIWVLMDQSLVTFEMYIIDLTQKTENEGLLQIRSLQRLMQQQICHISQLLCSRLKTLQLSTF
jgi:hypothetical protein